MIASTISYIICGQEPGMLTVPKSEDEFRRLITSLLLEFSECALLDNVEELKSSTLASVLTSQVFRNRPLHQNKTIELKNDALWIVTGNNPTLSRDILRRYIPIRLIPKTENPESLKSDDFRHPNIIEYVTNNRTKILASLIVLVQNWLDHGSPKGTYSLGSFEKWAEIIGGILDVAGIEGFLDNRQKLYQRSNSASDEMRVFFEKWDSQYGNQQLKASTLLKICQENEMLDDVIGCGSQRSQATKLGKYLKKHADKIFGKWRLRTEVDSHTGTCVYWLINVCNMLN